MFDTPDLSPLCLGAVIAVLAGILILTKGPTTAHRLSKGETRSPSGAFWPYLAFLVMPLVCCASWFAIGGVESMIQRLQPCPLPPRAFSESDLIGTWQAVGSHGDNLIVIREDHRYKQILHVASQEFDYEGTWNPWDLVYSESGLPYLQLQDLVMCGYWYQVDCRTGQTSAQSAKPTSTVDLWSNLDHWYDFCRKSWVDTHGERVLLVLGAEVRFASPRHGVYLAALSKSEISTGLAFEFMQP